MVKISLHDFRNADDSSRRVEVSEKWPATQFQGQAIQFPEGVDIDICLERHHDVLQLSGTVSTMLRLGCSRCTAEFDLLVSAALKDKIPLSREQDPEEQWGSSYLDSEQDLLDLSEYAMLAVLEQVPLQPLCRPDCRGLCPTCGQNLNDGSCNCRSEEIDPRFAVLKQLLKSDSE